MKKKLFLLASLVAVTSSTVLVFKDSETQAKVNLATRFLGSIDTVDLSFAPNVDSKTVELPELLTQLNQMIATAKDFKVDRGSYAIRPWKGETPTPITWTNDATENSVLQRLIERQGAHVSRAMMDVSKTGDWNNIAIVWTEVNSSEEFYASIGDIAWEEVNRSDYFLEKINIKYEIVLVSEQ